MRVYISSTGFLKSKELVSTFRSCEVCVREVYMCKLFLFKDRLTEVLKPIYLLCSFFEHMTIVYFLSMPARKKN